MVTQSVAKEELRGGSAWQQVCALPSIPGGWKDQSGKVPEQKNMEPLV